MAQYELEFCRKNIITDVSQIADSALTTDENKFKLIDRNPDTIYGGIGETAGSRSITITTPAGTTCDRLIFLGINWRNFMVFLDGSLVVSVMGNTKTNYYMRLDDTMGVLQIAVTACTLPLDIIKCSQIIATSSLYSPATDLVSSGNANGLNYKPIVSQRLNQLSDGTYDKTFIKSSFGFDISLSAITSEIQTSLKSVFNYNRSNSLFFIPEPDDGADWNGVCGHVHWANALDIYNATLGFTVNGYDAIINLIPASGIG